MHFERLFCGCLLLLSLGLLAVAWQYTAPISYDPIGPRPYPVLILSLLSLGLLSLTARPSRLLSAYTLQKSVLKNLVIACVAMLCYAFVFEVAGYIIATTVLAVVLGLLFGGQIIKVAIASVVMAVFTYFLFDRVLDVALPLGWLSFLANG